MARKSKAEKEEEARITRLYGSACDGVQIPILSVPAVWQAARAAARAGGDDAVVTQAIVAVVAKVRAN